LDQYANPANKILYRDWCVGKILDKLHNFNVIVSPIGTGGTVIGLTEGARVRLRSVMSVGVMCSPGNEIPGMRDISGMKEISLPWREAIDDCIEIDTKSAYLSALWLNWMMGVTSGPSGGASLAGTYSFIKKLKLAGNLDSIRDSRDGMIGIVIIIHDGWRPYLIDRFHAFLKLEDQRIETACLPWEAPL
jgi:cysteine synthase